MNKVFSQSIPIKEVLKDFARAFNVRLNVNCDEFTLTLPKAIGKGNIKGIDFKSGLGIIIYDCTFFKDTFIHFTKDDIHPIKFLFCEKGALEHRFAQEDVWNPIDLLENIIVASSHNTGHILKFQGGIHTTMNSLEIDRTVFEIDHDCEIDSLTPKLKTLFRDVKGEAAFLYRGDYCVKMANLFVEIKEFEETNFLRRVFLEGSAFKLLTLQVMQYDDDSLHTEDKSVLRKFELILVQKASSIIDNDILEYSSVKDLAHEVGLNINKLQSGFKEVHNNTINSYVHNRRLDLASTMLRNSEFTISEISYKVGLSSNSYFSKIFKEKYGLSPSEFRDNGNKER